MPILKRSFAGARPLYTGGGVRLTYYADGKRQDSPYREYFAGVDDYWPKNRWRMLWAWAFKGTWQRRPHQGFKRAQYNPDPKWGNGPHMPGMQRIDNGWSQYTRWCVPIDAETTRVFYIHATRPKTPWARLRDIALFPIRQRYLQYRQFGGQDDKALLDFRFDQPSISPSSTSRLSAGARWPSSRHITEGGTTASRWRYWSSSTSGRWRTDRRQARRASACR